MDDDDDFGAAAAVPSSALFEGIKFWISALVPRKHRLMALIQDHAGAIAPAERRADILIASKNSPPPGSLDVLWVLRCVSEQRLVPKGPYRVGRDPGSARPAGAAERPKSTRTPFTADDDRILREWTRGRSGTGGNQLYKDLERECPRHTWQSWRDRFRNIRGTFPKSHFEPREAETSALLHTLAPSTPALPPPSSTPTSRTATAAKKAAPASSPAAKAPARSPGTASNIAIRSSPAVPASIQEATPTNKPRPVSKRLFSSPSSAAAAAAKAAKAAPAPSPTPTAPRQRAFIDSPLAASSHRPVDDDPATPFSPSSRPLKRKRPASDFVPRQKMQPLSALKPPLRARVPQSSPLSRPWASTLAPSSQPKQHLQTSPRRLDRDRDGADAIHRIRQRERELHRRSISFSSKVVEIPPSPPQRQRAPDLRFLSSPPSPSVPPRQSSKQQQQQKQQPRERLPEPATHLRQLADETPTPSDNRDNDDNSDDDNDDNNNTYPPDLYRRCRALTTDHEALDAWIRSCSARGYPRPLATRALYHTTLTPGALAEVVMDYLGLGGGVPGIYEGIWTAEDDAALKRFSSTPWHRLPERDRRPLLAKHGLENVRLRRDFLAAMEEPLEDA